MKQLSFLSNKKLCPYCKKRTLYKAGDKTCGDDKCKKQRKRETWRERNPLKKKTCSVCNKIFLPESNYRKSCGSEECKKQLQKQYKKRYRTKPEKKAKEKEYYNKYKDIRKEVKKIYLKKNKEKLSKKAKENYRKKHPLIKKICVICKISFISGNKRHITCGSKECMEKNSKIKASIKGKKLRESLKVTKICCICKKPFKTNYDRIKTCGLEKCKKTFYTQQKNRPEKKEMAKKRSKLWNLINKDKKQKQGKLRYLKNRDKIRSRARELYYKINPLIDKICRICKKDFKTRRSVMVTCGSKECMEKNRYNLKKLHYFKNYSFKGIPISLKEIRKKYLLTLIEKQNYQCLFCGDKINMFNLSNYAIDHIKPYIFLKRQDVSIEKINCISNLQVLCISCNLKKGSKIMKLPYKEKANQACFNIMETLEEKGIAPARFAEIIEKHKELIKYRDDCYKEKDRPQKGTLSAGWPVFENAQKALYSFREKNWYPIISIFQKKGWYRITNFLDYYANNWSRLYGLGIAVGGFIPEGPEGDKILTEKSEKANLGVIDRDDFGSYHYWKIKKEGRYNEKETTPVIEFESRQNF